MRYESSQAKAPPQSRRRMGPPTPLQNSGSSFGEEQGRFEVVDQIWSARERTIIARTKQYLEKRKSIKVNIDELETLLGPDDSDVDFRRILEEARDKKGCAIFETFSADGPSKFVVVSPSRWDKHKRRLNAPWRHISSASASDGQWQEGLGRIKLVQSAISVPRKPMFRCDNQCSEKTLSFWQLASVVIKEGQFTTILRRQKEKTTDKLAVERVCGEKGAPWKALEYDGGKNHVHEKCGNIFAKTEKKSKKVSRGGRRRNASRNTRSVAAGIASERVPEAS